MPFLDKRALLSSVTPHCPVSIELGCGPLKRNPNSIGIDALDFPAVDLVGDVFEVLRAFPAGTVNGCYSSHFFEHIPETGRLMDELARVMRPGSELVVRVPHFSNAYFYSDPTHSRTFGLYSMSYLAKDDLLTRKVPLYGREPAFALQSVNLGLNSPFPIRGLLRRTVGWCVNRGPWFQEFYEENLTGLVSCYDIEFRLKHL